ncbi:MAG: serine hydrolase [Leptospiraceae bacterium]|nr:serine hydrolase [Leptospiraceae bacterium]
MKIAFTLIIFSLLYCSEQDPLKPFGPPLKIDPIQAKDRSFPNPGWKETTINKEKWKEFEKYTFETLGNEAEREGIRTDGIVIIQNGAIVYEKYARGYNKDMLHLTWSITKSFVNTMIGVAVKQGKLNIEDYASKYLEEFNRTDLHKKVKIKHILSMSSGLAANEGYESGPLTSSVVAMLYTRGRKDMGSFCASLDMAYEPGTFEYYSSCDSNILTKILTKVYSKTEYEDLVWKEIFSKLKINKASFEKDASGNFIGSSYLYLTARDLAKLGYLYLNDGVWEKERILPEGWVDYTRTSAEGYPTTKYYPKLETEIYTAHWYANNGVPERGIPKTFPDAPDDTFYGSGHWGQKLFVIPSLDLVIVRYGDDRDKTLSWNEFLKLAIAAVRK